MSEPLSGTGAAATALTGVSLYGLLTGADYGVLFGAFVGATYYIASANDLSHIRRIAYFFVSYLSGVLCSGLVGSYLTHWTGYADKPLDALGAVIVSALAIKALTAISNYDLTNFLGRFRGGSGNANK